MTISIERVGGTTDRLGESPVWNAGEGRLWWLDSLAGVLHRLDPPSGAHETFNVPAPVGSVGLHAEAAWCWRCATGSPASTPGAAERRRSPPSTSTTRTSG